jgi:hypothetical protein
MIAIIREWTEDAEGRGARKATSTDINPELLNEIIDSGSIWRQQDSVGRIFPPSPPTTFLVSPPAALPFILQVQVIWGIKRGLRHERRAGSFSSPPYPDRVSRCSAFRSRASASTLALALR